MQMQHIKGSLIEERHLLWQPFVSDTPLSEKASFEAALNELQGWQILHSWTTQEYGPPERLMYNIQF